MPLPGQGKRIEQLVFDLSAKLGRRITLAEFGELVGKAESGRNRPYSKSGVSEWIQERNEPTLAAFVAMAVVSAKHTPPGRSREWIIFGDEETVPMLAAVPAQSDAERAAAKKPSRRRRRG